MVKAKSQNYDFFSIVLHWLIALLIVTVFVTGVWMVTLDYYNPWFQLVPWWHKGLGFIAFVLVVIRTVWHCYQPKPQALSTFKPWQMALSSIVHFIMNVLAVLLMISGYFIVTAQGQALRLFDFIVIPALLDSSSQLEDFAGLVHCYLAYSLIILAVGHVAMALKHHFIDHDRSLMRILGQRSDI